MDDATSLLPIKPKKKIGNGIHHPKTHPALK
jgi:hypothetical protein